MKPTSLRAARNRREGGQAIMRLGRRASLLVAFYVLLVAGCAPRAVTTVQPTDDLNINAYGKTAWGMTPDQVLKAEAPRAKKVEKPDQSRDLISAIAIDEIQLGTGKFGVKFYFDADLRLQVFVRPLDQEDPQANARTFSFLEKHFTGKSVLRRAGRAGRLFASFGSYPTRLFSSRTSNGSTTPKSPQ